MQRGYILITGGAGFIGTNVARNYLRQGQPVHIFDNLSRPGVEQNIFDLQQDFGGRVHFTRADLRDRNEVDKAVATASAVYHLAAQVAVTTSLNDPLGDLGTNLIGTLHVLEAIRHSAAQPPLLFTSTNKVYGHLAGIPLAKRASRYEPQNAVIARSGAGEDQPARVSFAVRMLERQRRSIRPRFRPVLRPARHRVSHELHLWSSSTRLGGPRLGRTLPPSSDEGRVYYDLRRRQAGSRSSVRRRFGSRYGGPHKKT